MKLALPEEVLTQNIIAFGKPGSGKSSKLRVLVEHLLTNKKAVCILDPKGDWWGLKLAADGKGAGFPLLIFGGDHADIPITEHAGAQVAEVVASGSHAVLIDLGGWMPGARSRFFVDFASTLFRMPHPPLHLIMDEAHNFAPQGKVLDPIAGKCLHWGNRLASEGRSKGITIIAASQRPQKVHKDFVTTCETLIAGRVIHALDRQAVKDWIDGCADPTTGKQVIVELASMPRNEAWVWSPEIDFGPKRIAFKLFTTFDSFSPQAGLQQRILPAPMGLEEIRQKLAGVVAEAEKNDPSKLQRRIAELEKQTRLNERMFTQQQVNQLIKDAIIAERKESAVPIVTTSDERALHDALEKIASIANKLLAEDSPAPIKNTNSFTPVPKQSAPAGGPEKRILNAIAWWEAAGMNPPFSKTQVAFIANYTPGSGAFNNPLGKLKSAGKVDYPSGGMVCLTNAGRAEVDPIESPTTTEALQQRIFSKLSGPEQRILKVLIDCYPSDMDKSELARAAGYTPGSGAFNNPMGSLRSLELVDYPRKSAAVALPLLFIE